jgi:hypothetical protein
VIVPFPHQRPVSFARAPEDIRCLLHLASDLHEPISQLTDGGFERIGQELARDAFALDRDVASMRTSLSASVSNCGLPTVRHFAAQLRKTWRIFQARCRLSMKSAASRHNSMPTQSSTSL